MISTNQTWISSPVRSQIYSFLSACFRDEITPDTITAFLGKKAETIKALQHVSEKDSAEMESIIDEISRGWTEVSGEKRLQLRKEFAFLFLTPSGVKPFESVYRGKKKLLMDKPWEEVRSFFRELGLEKSPEEDHPEDHAAVELGFMANFAHMTSKTEVGDGEWQELVAIQDEFLQNHISLWIPDLCDDILEKEEKIEFYGLIARLAKAFIGLENNLFNQQKGRE